MTQPATTEDRSQLQDYLAVLKLRKWSILAVALLVVGGAMALSARQTPIYESQAKVLVEVSKASTTGVTTQPVNLETERQLITSSQVAEIVAEDIEETDDPRRLLRGLAVDVIPKTEIMGVTYRHPDPTRAKDLAQAFADGYLEFRRQKAQEEFRSARRTLLDKKDRLLEQQQQLQEQLTGTPQEDGEREVGGPTDAAQVQQQINQLSGQLALVQQDIDALQPDEFLKVGQVVEPARIPSSPSSPNHVQNGILGLLVGLALGVGIAFLRERLDDGLRGRLDLESRARAPVLGVIPNVGSWRRRRDTPLVTMSASQSGTAEAFRTLRTSLLFAAAEKGVKTVMVSSSHVGEGKTAVSANLAAVLAQAGKRVIAVSADLRKPRLHRFFAAENGTGVTSVLIGDAEPWEAVQDVGIPNLRLIPSGPVPGNPAELLGSDAMRQLISQFRDLADFVVIDSPPLLVVSDALAMAPLVDAVLFLADAEQTTRGAVNHARHLLDQVDAHVIGAVLNNFDASKARQAAYYYDYYYSYHAYEDEDGQRPLPRQKRRRRGRGPKEGVGFEEPATLPERASKPATSPSAMWEGSPSDRTESPPEEAVPAVGPTAGADDPLQEAALDERITEARRANAPGPRADVDAPRPAAPAMEPWPREAPGPETAPEPTPAPEAPAPEPATPAMETPEPVAPSAESPHASSVEAQEPPAVESPEPTAPPPMEEPEPAAPAVQWPEPAAPAVESPEPTAPPARPEAPMPAWPPVEPPPSEPVAPALERQAPEPVARAEEEPPERPPSWEPTAAHRAPGEAPAPPEEGPGPQERDERPSPFLGLEGRTEPDEVGRKPLVETAPENGPAEPKPEQEEDEQRAQERAPARFFEEH